MTHLGDRVTDLVDGQLGPEAAERAHEHLAGCRRCRQAAEADRLTKARLGRLAAPAPSADLVGRLLAIGGAEPAPAAQAVRSMPAGGGVPGRPLGSRPAGRPAGRSVRADGVRPGGRLRPARRGRFAVAVFGTLSVVGMGASGLVFSSVPMAPVAVLPAVATLVVERTASNRDLPFVDILLGRRSDANTANR